MHTLSLFVIMLTLAPLIATAQTRPDDDLRAPNAALGRPGRAQESGRHVLESGGPQGHRPAGAVVHGGRHRGEPHGRPGDPLKGRKQIGDTFRSFLSGFETVYHINGQQTVSIQGDTASGTAYCLVVLIGRQNDAASKTTMGVRYADEYVRRNGSWLISKRTSNFMWRETTPMASGGR